MHVTSPNRKSAILEILIFFAWLVLHKAPGYRMNKIRCTENYFELHETKNIYENPINQGLIWDVF